MKNVIKKSVFGLFLVGVFSVGTLINIDESEASGNVYNCYSASSGSKDGAYFYDCSTCRKVEDKEPTGPTLECSNGPRGGGAPSIVEL